MGRSDDSSVSPTTRPIETQSNEGAREPVVWETVEVGSTIKEMVAQLRLIDEVREFGAGTLRGLFEASVWGRRPGRRWEVSSGQMDRLSWDEGR